MTKFLKALTSRAALVSALAFAIAMATISIVSAEDLGPAVGLKAPAIGTLPDQTGAPRAMAELMGSKGLVLVFFRSAQWCPYCQGQLISLNDGLPEIEKRGYRIAALSYDSTKILADFTAQRHIGYTLLSDPRSEIIDFYRLRDPQYPADSKAYGVPRPIIFVIDRDGVIKAKLFEETYRTRPPVSAITSTLDRLAGSN